MKGPLFFFSDISCVFVSNDRIVVQSEGEEEKTLFQDQLPLTSLVLLENEFVVFGGESKTIYCFSLVTGNEVWRKQSKRKIFSLLKLSKEDILFVDSAGSVRSVAWRTGENVKDLFAHFSSVTAALVMGPFIVTADMDCQVRVVKASAPRDIVCFLLGNRSPVKVLYAKDDDTVVSVNAEREMKMYSIRSGGTEIEVKLDLDQPLLNEYLRAKKQKKTEDGEQDNEDQKQNSNN